MICDISLYPLKHTSPKKSIGDSTSTWSKTPKTKKFRIHCQTSTYCSNPPPSKKHQILLLDKIKSFVTPLSLFQSKIWTSEMNSPASKTPIYKKLEASNVSNYRIKLFHLNIITSIYTLRALLAHLLRKWVILKTDQIFKSYLLGNKNFNRSQNSATCSLVAP